MDERIYIWGKNPVCELIRAKSRPILNIYVQDSRVKDYSQFLAQHKVRFSKMNKGKMHNLINRSDHQGIILETREYQHASFAQIAEINSGLIILAEGITDPQNLGAMIRSAFILGASGLIIPEKFSASITSVVTHTSAGATEHLAIAQVNSISHCITELQNRDFEILAALPPGDNVSDIRDINCKPKTALLMGSEGYGIKKSTLANCDKYITIPQAGHLDSFSVSAATAILAYQIASKMGII